jgi:hypothetical protein
MPVLVGSYGGGGGAPLDWNQQQLLLQQREREQMLPIVARMQEGREQRELDWATTAAKLNQDWASGGREMQFQAGQADMDRMLREAMLDKEFAFRAKEAAAGRGHELTMADVQDALARRRMQEGHAQDLQRMGIQREWQLDDRGVLREQQLSDEERQRGHTLEDQQRLRGWQLDDRGVLREQQLGDETRRRGWSLEDEQRMRGYSEQDAMRDRGWSLEDDVRNYGQQLGLQNLTHQQSLDRMGVQNQYITERDTAQFQQGLQSVETQQLMGMASGVEQFFAKNQFSDPVAQEQWGELRGELMEIRRQMAKGDYRPGVYQQELAQWLKKAQTSGLENYVQPEVPLQDQYMRDTIIDQQTGARLQRNSKGEWTPIGGGSSGSGGVSPRVSDMMSEGKPVSFADYYGPQADPDRKRFNTAIESTRKQMVDEYMTKNPESLGYEPSYDEVLNKTRERFYAEQQFFSKDAQEAQAAQKQAEMGAYLNQQDVGREQGMAGTEGPMPSGDDLAKARAALLERAEAEFRQTGSAEAKQNLDRVRSMLGGIPGSRPADRLTGVANSRIPHEEANQQVGSLGAGGQFSGTGGGATWDGKPAPAAPPVGTPEYASSLRSVLGAMAEIGNMKALSDSERTRITSEYRQQLESLAVTISTPEEAQTLPPGTVFRTPDGKLRIRQ